MSEVLDQSDIDALLSAVDDGDIGDDTGAAKIFSRSRRDLENADNPYNTYRHAGLPPGPIANPWLHALRAVVYPAESDYLFFVSRNDGTHVFSATYREHVNAVNRYQRRRASR